MSLKEKAIKIILEIQNELISHHDASLQDIGTIVVDAIGHGDFEGELVNEYPELYEMMDLAGSLEVPQGDFYDKEIYDELMAKIEEFKKRIQNNVGFSD